MNAKIKPFNKSTKQCPYCADPDFLASFTEGGAKKIRVLLPAYMRQNRFWKKGRLRRPDYTAHAEGEQRGDRLRVVFDEENFDQRWRDFTVEVFGIESTSELILPRTEERVYHSPPPPFFYAISVPQGENQPFKYQQFFICRITHKKSDVSILVHWWADHGRVMRIDSSLSWDATNDSLGIIKTGCEFFQRETRGAEKKITDERLKRVLSKLGNSATQVSAAKELKVSETALEKWRRRQGIESWRDVVSRYSAPN